MKVKSLNILSFRGIGNLTLDFHQKHPTILIGINGIGKSSILDCLAILLSEFTNSFQYPYYTSYESVFTEEDITNGKIQTQNEINILFDSKIITWSLTKSRQESIKNTINKLSDIHKFNIPVLVYYLTNRSVLDIPLRITTKHSFNIYDNALKGIGNEFKLFFEWLIENELQLKETAHIQLEIVKKAIYLMMPEFSNLRIQHQPLRITLQKDGEELTVNQLSNGEKCLLAMVGDLARRLAIANPGLSNPLQGNGIILIDEIEIHLHPKLQREIIPNLTRTFPNCQFILTTHSPQVISNVKPEGIYILEKSPSGIIAKRPKSSFGKDSNCILNDLMNVPERPQEIKERLLEIFKLIDAGNLEGAKKVRQNLASEIGADEPEFVKADVLIRKKEKLI